MLRFGLILVFLLLCHSSARSQGVAAGGASPDSEIRFRHLETMSDAQPSVFEVYQDEVGFLWFGTDDGLFRYDGTSYRTHRPIPFDSTSLADPWINGMVAAGPHSFWIVTSTGGLHRYEATEDRFSRFADRTPVRLSHLVVDADSMLWIATRYDGLVRYNPMTDETKEFRADPDDSASLPSDQLLKLMIDKDGVLWVATYDGGVCLFDRYAGTCRTFRYDAANPNSIPSDRVEALIEDSLGRVWVGTSNDGADTRGVGGVARFDRAAGTFARYSVAAAQEGGLNVLSLLQHPNGEILIGSGAGLASLDPESGRYRLYTHSIENTSTIASGNVQALYLDNDGVIWVGTVNGVSYFNSQPSAFRHIAHEPDNENSLNSNDVWAILEDEDGILWIGTNRGLNRIDRDTGDVIRIAPDENDPAKLLSRLVMGVNQTKDGTIWVGTRRGGLHVVDKETGQIAERFVRKEGDPGSLQTDNPWWILEDSKQRTWISSGGVGCLQQMLEPGRFKSFCHDDSDEDTPSHDWARYMIEGRDGTLWLATWGGGLDRIDPDTLLFKHYKHNPADRNTPTSDFILSIYEDDEGILWLGTYGGGLSRFEPTTETFTHFTTNDSDLPSDAVYGIQPDDDGRLWLSTNGGLVRFDPVTGAMRVFGLSDGIQALEFNSGASFRSKSGELFFGGINGVNAFFPSEVGNDSTRHRVVMTSLQAGGSMIERPGPEAPIQVALPYVDEIRLRPNERDITIGFASLQFLQSDLNRYRYKLDGYDDKWVEAGRKQTATYTNLDRGRYTFRVAASNSDGIWTEDALVVEIDAAPFFYETTLAWILYGLALVGFLVWLFRYRRNRLILQHKLEIEHLETQKLRELDRSRSLFFANVSHEFRTPLTLTLGPVDDVLAGAHGAVSSAARKQLVLARRNAARVLDLINQILDVARLEAGKTQLRASRLDLGTFVEEVARAFESLAERKNITFTIEKLTSSLDVWADPLQLEKVLTNLLSNAFKFTRGTVRVTVFSRNQSVCFSVRDNGHGIPEEEIPLVFDRFHQVSSASPNANPGTGIGLALSREIVELHGGYIELESEEGFGSTFTVRLPEGRAHLREDQLSELPYKREAVVEDSSPSFVSHETDASEDAELTDSGDVAPNDDDVTTILVVEDHPDVRAYIRFHLEPDYRVVEAENGERALEIVRATLPDLVLSDVMMPVMDGFELCRRLKSDPDTDFLPVILLTAKATHGDRVEGLSEHADDYLTKPFDPVELRLRLSNAIESRKRLKQRLVAELSSLGQSVGSTLVAGPEVRSDESGPRDADTVFVDRVLEVIGRRFSDETFTVELLAEEVGVSRAQLFRTIRKVCDKAPSDLIRDIRLEHAATMLANNSGNVSEVAYATGFKSLAHFSRCFTRKYECRPSAYRAALEEAQTVRDRSS